MAIILPNGTVIESNMRMGTLENRGSAVKLKLNNSYLSVGYIVKVNEPTQQIKEITYDVKATILYDMEGETDVIFHNCRVMRPVGMGYTKDYARLSIRGPEKYDGLVTDELIAESSKVLVLCANGRSDTAWIIGSALHPDSETEQLSDGHTLGFHFNGIDFKIDKDGQLSLVFNGATVNDQNQDMAADPSVAGTNVQITKDGNIVIDDAKGESITLDNKNKKLTIQSRELETTVTDKNWTIEVKGNVNLHSSKDVTVNADGKTYIGPTGSTENMVLGQKLATACSELCQVFIQNAANFCALGNLGAPVPLGPNFLADLTQWLTKYGLPTSQFLSKTKFTAE